MIELTEEMKAVVKRRTGVNGRMDLDPWTEAALRDVLAIVERDYRVEKRVRLHCGAAGPDGITCLRTPEHDNLHAWASDGELVKW